jgi:DNA-binding MarR family transcriptional regulator
MSPSRNDLLGEALEEVLSLMSIQRRAFCAEPVHREVSMLQVYILFTLQERGSMTVSDLGHLLQISAPSASSIVDRMEERELVERVRDDADRRVVHVDISATGRSTIERLTGMKRDHIQSVFGLMTDDELEDVIRGSRAVRAALTRLGQVTETAVST